MKHSLLKHILLWVLAINALPMAAYDYLKIYFKDGHTERHLMNLVEGISTTKYDLEGNLHSDYQMQQIVMQDATYSYYLADIDSMTFKRADDEQVKANVEAVSNNVVPIFEQCSSIEEMETHIDEIKAMECVENVWREGTDIVVQIRDWKKVFFKYPLVPEIDDNYLTEIETSLTRNSESQMPIKSDGTPMKVGIAFQMVDDSRFIDEKVYLVKLKNKFKQMGFDAYYIEELNLDFFDRGMFDYDILFLATHGCYAGKHYLCTSIKTDILDDVKIRIKNMENDIDDVQYAFFQTEAWAIDSPIPTGSFLVVSENYIQNSQHKFTGPGPHIIFNAACSSLYGWNQLTRENDGEQFPGNDSMAKVFFNKGADIYFGETNDSRNSRFAGINLFLFMLKGASEEIAFRSLIDEYKFESKDESALLDLFNPNSAYDPLKSLFLNGVQTEERSEQEINNEYKSNGQIELKGRVSPLTDIVYAFGFRLATKPIVDNMTDYKDLKSNNAHFSGTKNGEVLFSSTMIPEPGQTYYYRAYTYDGLHHNYGETYAFKIEDTTPSTIKVEPEKIDFGEIKVGSSKTEYFTVSNVGKSKLTFKVSEEHGTFEIPESGKEFTLEAGESKKFSVKFSLSEENTQAGSSVRIFSDAENGTQYLKLSGRTGSSSSNDPIAYTSCPDDHHPHMIDLGLPSGTLWACCNVDTEHPEKQTPTNYGGYYAWGEIAVKGSYELSNYEYFQNGEYVDLGSDIAGTKYDVAHVKWGDSWVMPSMDQQDELCEKCSSERTTFNGVGGIRFTGPNGGSIFLPTAGFRYNDRLYYTDEIYYWSSTRRPNAVFEAYILFFELGLAYLNSADRSSGVSVRPVISK